MIFSACSASSHTLGQKYSSATMCETFQSNTEMYLDRMSFMPLETRRMGAPFMMSRSVTTREGAHMGVDFFWPLMIAEQMLAVKPSDDASVGIATKGMPSLYAG